MSVLVVNAGSSTLRYSIHGDDGSELFSRTLETQGEINAALDRMFSELNGQPTPTAVGHRVVHGGARLTTPVLVDDDVIRNIEAASTFAPLHNPVNLAAIQACREVWPQLPQVAVFDTAFHATLPACASRYALPASLTHEHGLRRFGFHGISHEQLMLDASSFLAQAPQALNLITFHLGNGASATAIKQGQSVDTSMGMTPAEGLVMGTRAGDVDPGLLTHLLRTQAINAEKLDAIINRESGLLGLCGDADMRKIRARMLAGDQAATHAVETYVYRIRKYLGAYFAVLGRVDALVFSGGVGEHHLWLVGQVLKDLPLPGLSLAPTPDDPPPLPVNLASDQSKVAVLILHADECRSIACHTLKLLEG